MSSLAASFVSSSTSSSFFSFDWIQCSLSPHAKYQVCTRTWILLLLPPLPLTIEEEEDEEEEHEELEHDEEEDG